MRGCVEESQAIKLGDTRALPVLQRQVKVQNSPFFEQRRERPSVDGCAASRVPKPFARWKLPKIPQSLSSVITHFIKLRFLNDLSEGNTKWKFNSQLDLSRPAQLDLAGFREGIAREANNVVLPQTPPLGKGTQRRWSEGGTARRKVQFTRGVSTVRCAKDDDVTVTMTVTEWQRSEEHTSELQSLGESRMPSSA